MESKAIRARTDCFYVRHHSPSLPGGMAGWLMSHHSRALFLLSGHDRLGVAILRPCYRGQWGSQRLAEQLIDGLNRKDFQPTLYIVRDLGEILLVLLRDQYGLQAAAKGRQQLLLETANRQHPATQRNFSGHGDVALNRDPAQYRHDRGHHGDPSRWSILGRRTLRHVDVDVLLLEYRRSDAEEVAARLDETLRGLDRFLHDVAELTGRRNAPLSGNCHRLDRQQLTTDLRPSEPGGDPDQILTFGLAKTELAHPGVLFQVAPRNRHALGLVHQDVFDRLSRQIGDFALKITNPRLARVIPDHIAYCVVADAPLVLANAVRRHLLRDQMAARDLHLLVLGVAGNADDLHAVEQGLWDPQCVRRGDEHHVREVVIHLEVVIVEGPV